MRLRVLQTDFIKMKVGIWILVFLGPIGIFALHGINYGIRYDWLMSQTTDPWGQLLGNINMFSNPCPLAWNGSLASLSANLEHHTNAWKQLLALPISRISVYSSKFTLIAILLFISTCLTFFGTIGFGLVLGFKQAIPFSSILQNSFYPFFASLPILSLQLWLSITLHNQGLPLTIGIVGAVLSMYAYYMPNWVIWKWPLLVNQWDLPELNVIFGITLGFIILIIGLLDFQKRDVK
jgi:hypothetical protein